MMKKLFTLMLLYSMMMSAWAQNAVSIHQIDGKVATFLFSDKPTVTYSGNELVLTTSKTAVQYPIYMLQKLVFNVETGTTAVEEVKQKTGAVKFSFEDGALVIIGGEPNTAAYLYNVGGTMIGQCRLDSNGRGSIAVNSQEKDLYIVKTSSVTFKFRIP